MSEVAVGVMEQRLGIILPHFTKLFWTELFCHILQNYFGQHYLETFHKIVLDTIILPHFTKLFLTQLFCHILQNYFGQHYFATFHQIILETIILPHFTKLFWKKLFCHISRHYFGQNYFATFHKKIMSSSKLFSCHNINYFDRGRGGHFSPTQTSLRAILQCKTNS